MSQIIPFFIFYKLLLLGEAQTKKKRLQIIKFEFLFGGH